MSSPEIIEGQRRAFVAPSVRYSEHDGVALWIVGPYMCWSLRAAHEAYEMLMARQGFKLKGQRQC